MPHQMRQIAIYDMDKTITQGPTLVPYLTEAVKSRASWRVVLVPLLLPLFLVYGVKLIDRAQLKAAMQGLFIGSRFSERALAPVNQAFAEKLIDTGLKPGAVKQIAADKAAGRMLVMATASSQFYVDQIGEMLGFDVVIGTKSTRLPDGRLSPRIDGGNCYGQNKADRIVAWMAEAGIARGDCHIAFYSDHVSDLPSFLLADVPVPVDPDPKLEEEAVARGWRIERWG